MPLEFLMRLSPLSWLGGREEGWREGGALLGTRTEEKGEEREEESRWGVRKRSSVGREWGGKGRDKGRKAGEVNGR